MDEKPDFIQQLADVLEPIEKTEDADVIFYSGGIAPPSDQGIFSVTKLKRHKNLILMLTTLGGSPDTAYRIARCLRKTYHDGKFTVFVDTLCKSAGTLITLAADQMIMSDTAHLGPLDIQVPEKEEVGEMSSGLTPTQALTTLKLEAWRLFDEHFVKLRYRPGFRFPTKMAGQIAARMTIGLLRPIYEQIDPMRLGENERSLRIAGEYGQRLASKNLKDRALARLVSGYPSHTFVIDRHEAKELFNSVREPNKEEAALAAELSFLAEKGQEEDERGYAATIYSISDIVYRDRQAKMKSGDANEQRPSGTDRVGTAGSGSTDAGTAGAGGKTDTAVSTRLSEDSSESPKAVRSVD